MAKSTTRTSRSKKKLQDVIESIPETTAEPTTETEVEPAKPETEPPAGGDGSQFVAVESLPAAPPADAIAPTCRATRGA